jgi:hypothetical protein
MAVLHTHSVKDPDGTTVVLEASTGYPHAHRGRWSNGNEFMTSESDDGPNHGHQVVLADGVVLAAGTAITVVPNQDVGKSAYPEVLTWTSVRNQWLPDVGSGLPESLESDVPGRFRFWQLEKRDDQLAVRRALVESGICAEPLLRDVVIKDCGQVVGTELHRIEYKADGTIMVPSVDDTRPEPIAHPPDIEVAASVAGLENALQMSAEIVDVFGFDETVDRCVSSNRDWVVQIAAESPQLEVALKRFDSATLFCNRHSGDHVYLTSTIPDDGIDWVMASSPDAVQELLKRQNVSPADIVKNADDVESESLADLVAGVVAIVSKRAAWSAYDERVAARAVVTIDRATREGDGTVLKALGVDPERTATLNAITKRADVKIYKTDAEERIVYGVVMEPNVVDLQDDISDYETIRTAAHQYLAFYGEIGLQHNRIITGSAVIIESFVAPVDFAAGDQLIRRGSWVMAAKVLDDEYWRRVKAGEITGFSIGGKGKRIPIHE